MANQKFKNFVKVIEKPLDLQGIVNEVSLPEAGGIAVFTGTTRNHHQGKEVLKLEYEAYVPMAEKEMGKICDQVRTKWKDILHIALYHRIGVVPIGEASVIVAISSEHRKDGLEACHYAIDEIKSIVPIWKKEFYKDGSVWKENQEWRHKHKC